MDTCLETILLNGMSVDYKNKLFITPYIRSGVIKKKGYQVICEKKGLEFNCLYYPTELSVAIDKFILLKNKL